MSKGILNQHTGYHNRRSIRLPKHDYTKPGYYFITICIHNRYRCLFGNIVDGQITLNEFGRIAHDHFVRLSERFSNIITDVFQIMPNHVHAVIVINPGVGAGLAPAPLSTVAPMSVSDGHQHGSGTSVEKINFPDYCNENMVTHGSHGIVDNHESVLRNGIDLNGIGASDSFRAGASPAPTDTGTGMGKTVPLGNVVGAYKSLVANDCLKIYLSRNQYMGKLWQRNYYDHIVRDEMSLPFIRKYIRENPLHWIDDATNHVDRELRDFDMNMTGND